MKNFRLVKIIVIALIFLIGMVCMNRAFAITDLDLNTELAIGGNNATTNTNTPTNTNTNTPTNTNTSTNINALNTSALSTNNNTSNNTNVIPHAGIEDNIVPMGLLLVVFAISAIYAYKKIQDYKEI